MDVSLSVQAIGMFVKVFEKLDLCFRSQNKKTYLPILQDTSQLFAHNMGNRKSKSHGLRLQRGLRTVQASL